MRAIWGLGLAFMLAGPALAEDCAEGQDGCGGFDRFMGELLNRVDPWFRDLGELLRQAGDADTQLRPRRFEQELQMGHD